MSSDPRTAAETLEIMLMLGGPYRMAHRVAILGNSGSGKSTLARVIAAMTGAALLDLDTVTWEPGHVAVPRDAAAAKQDVRAFCTVQESWVVEGCYGSLVREALDVRPQLLLLDPSVPECVANCRARPWEPHKYASKEEQDALTRGTRRLGPWIRDACGRTGPGRPPCLF